MPILSDILRIRPSVQFGPNGRVITECEVKLSRPPGRRCDQLLSVWGFGSDRLEPGGNAEFAIMTRIAAKLLNR